MKKSKDKRNKTNPSRQTLYKLYMRTRMMATCSVENINNAKPVLMMKDIITLTHDYDGNPASLDQTATVFMALHAPYSSKLTTFDEFLADLAVITAYTPPAMVEASVNAAVVAITEADASKAVKVPTSDSETEEDEESDEDSDEGELSESEDSEDEEENEGEDNDESDEDSDESDEEEEIAEVAPTPPPKLEIPPDVRRKKKKKKNKKHKKNG